MSFENLDVFDMVVIVILAIVHLAMWFMGVDEMHRCVVVAAMIGYLVAGSRERW